MAPVLRTVIDLDGNSIALALAGEHDAHLKILEQRLDCKLTLRGNVLILEGPDDAVGKARAALEELLTVIRSGRPLSPAMVESLMDGVLEFSEDKLRVRGLMGASNFWYNYEIGEEGLKIKV